MALKTKRIAVIGGGKLMFYSIVFVGTVIEMYNTRPWWDGIHEFSSLCWS
jgi:hypothetical protein